MSEANEKATVQGESPKEFGPPPKEFGPPPKEFGPPPAERIDAVEPDARTKVLRLAAVLARRRDPRLLADFLRLRRALLGA